MENEETLREIKRELYKEIDILKRKHLSFKKRISIIMNLLIPGFGFFIYGEALFKGVITFILFFAYNYLFFNTIVKLTDISISILFYIPAVIIWLVSTLMVSALGD